MTYSTDFDVSAIGSSSRTRFTIDRIDSSRTKTSQLKLSWTCGSVVGRSSTMWFPMVRPP